MILENTQVLAIDMSDKSSMLRQTESKPKWLLGADKNITGFFL
jgi:hypothetical protein